MKMQELFLSRTQEGGRFSFFKMHNLSNTQKLEILMKKDGKLHTVALPTTTLERIAEYLRKSSSESWPDIDCSGFAHFANGIPWKAGVFDLNRWNMTILDEETMLRPGDTVCITQSSPSAAHRMGNIVHFAIFLGEGLYLSKFGMHGPLIVTTLEEMERGYHGDQAYLAKPKEEDPLSWARGLVDYGRGEYGSDRSN